MHTAHPHLNDCPWLDLEALRDATLFITGGTGLVGYNVLRQLTQVSEELNLRILALVRDPARAAEKFAAFGHRVTLMAGDVQDTLSIDEPIDYILHGASPTASSFFVEKPVETVLTAVEGTRNMLELARQKQVRGMVYLSSMEVYGTMHEPRLLTEQDLGHIDPLQVRSSYPEGKRLCETLCAAYCKEYGVPVRIARLVQTFGPGISPEDKRVVVQFIQSALQNQPIEIKASGESARMYLYTFDAVSALLTLLVSGDSGTAYNVANKDSYSSIKELAQTVMGLFGATAPVLTNTGTEEERRMYPPDTFLRLDTSRLEGLGWRPLVSHAEGLRALAESF